MNSYPKGDKSRKAIRDVRFPPLKDNHPALKVVRTSTEDGL